jgi:hypothetical protein
MKGKINYEEKNSKEMVTSFNKMQKRWSQNPTTAL